MKILSTIGSKYLVQPQLNDSSFGNIKDFNISLQLFQIPISSSFNTVITSSDVVYNYQSASIVQYLNNIIITYSSDFDGGYTYTNFNPEILTLDANGNTVNYITNGSASVNVVHGKRTKNILVPSYQSPSTLNKLFGSFVSGSVAYNISSSISASISDKITSTSSYNIFSNIDDINKNYIRNTNLFCSNTDWSCIPANRDNQQTGKGCLVTSDIIITANHVGAGSIYYFVDNNNTTISASVSASYNIPNTDLLVVRLSSYVTSSVKSAKIIHPSQIGTKLTTSSFATNNIYSIYTNQFRTFRLGIQSNPNNYLDYISAPDISSSLYPWWSKIISGDSGNAYMLSIGNEPYLIGTWYFSAGGPAVTYFFDQINTAITNLGSSTQLITSSLNEYFTY